MEEKNIEKARDFEVLLHNIETSPFRRMECQIEIGVKNARRNWKKKAISDEDYKRILSSMWVPVKDIRGLILHLASFEEDYKTELTRLHEANQEKWNWIQQYEAAIKKLVTFIQHIPVDKLTPEES
jgi:hypothetical protein